MKLKHLIMVSFFLAILTIGAVSASEDMLSDDKLAVDDNMGDSVAESSNDEISVDDVSQDSIVGSPNDANEIDATFGDVKIDRELSDEFNTDLDMDGKVALLIDNVQNDVSVKTVSNAVESDFCPVTYFDFVSVGETNYIRYDTDAFGKTGNISVYTMNEDTKGVYITTVTVSNSKATIPMVESSVGQRNFWLDFNVDGHTFSHTVSYYVCTNSPGFSASVSSEVYAGGSASVTFSGPYTGEVNIYVDGTKWKSVQYNGGTLSQSISGLSLGNHQVSVKYHKDSYYFSKTYNVNVVKKPDAKKPNTIKLKLKKVKVRKSAKKLVLKATLKINGKAKKGVKLTFKFNGKKFKAKTNKKGIAKVKIKKKFLKKLKVGKKVRYQVSYGKKTVKRTAKVKK